MELKGIVVGQGNTYVKAFSDIKSVIILNRETFGLEVLEIDPLILYAFIAETEIAD